MRAIPESYYTGVGRVTVAAAKLEMNIAEVASELLGLPTTRHFGDLAGRPGKAMRKFREAMRSRPDLADLPTLHDAARALFDERNGYVHGVIVHTASPAPQPLSYYLALQRPSDGSSRPLPSAGDLADLTDRLERLAGEFGQVWGKLLEKKAAADSMRTVEG